MTWWERAACRGMDREVFYAPPDSGDVILALATCAGCPVREQCLELAMRAESGTYREGIFGGYTAEQRKALARARTDAAEVDEAAILRRADGDRVPLLKHEAIEVVTRLRRRGLSDNEIARRTRLKVERYAPPRGLLREAS